MAVMSAGSNAIAGRAAAPESRGETEAAGASASEDEYDGAGVAPVDTSMEGLADVGRAPGIGRPIYRNSRRAAPPHDEWRDIRIRCILDPPSPPPSKPPRRALLLSLTSEAFRRTRAPAYFVAGLMFFIPLIDIAVNASPYRIHDPNWRVALITTSVGASATILFALLITYLVGVFAEDRPTGWLVGIISALMAVLCIGAAGAFVLDALQLRAQVPPGLEGRYNLASAWAFAKICLAVAGAAVLSINAFRSARSMQRASGRRGTKAPSVVLGSSTPVGSVPTAKQGSRAQLLPTDSKSATVPNGREL